MINERKLLLKASSINNLTDARYFSSKGVDWMGFCFDRNSDVFIPPIEAQQIMKWVEGPIFVGEFGNQSLAEMKEITMIMNIDLIQIKSACLSQDLLQLPKTKIVEFNISRPKDFSELTEITKKNPLIDYWSLRISKNSYEEVLPEMRKFCTDHQVIIDIEDDPEWLEKILKELAPAGINICGTPEDKVGEKTFDHLESIFELLQEEF